VLHDNRPLGGGGAGGGLWLFILEKGRIA